MGIEDSTPELVAAARAGDADALAALFQQHAPWLRRLAMLRLDQRLQGRIDVDDVLQEFYVEYARCISRYDAYQQLPFRLWLRMIAGRKLQALHRHHLGVAARDADREVSLHRGPLPDVSSCALAIQLLGRNTSPTQAVARAELQLQIQAALNELAPLDREILALRHFEELSNSEVARVLDISPAAASNRYVRALRRIQPMMAQLAQAHGST